MQNIRDTMALLSKKGRWLLNWTALKASMLEVNRTKNFLIPREGRRGDGARQSHVTDKMRWGAILTFFVRDLPEPCGPPCPTRSLSRSSWIPLPHTML